MKLFEVLETEEQRAFSKLRASLKGVLSNRDKAKKIRTKQKFKAKEANPGDSDTVHGWRSDPHQGSHGSNFLGRAVS